MNIEELNNYIKLNDALLIYFSSENCGVCKVLKPKVKYAVDTKYPKIKQLEIKIEENMQLVRQLGIFSMPTILIYFDKQEFYRKERNISIQGLIEDIKKPYNMFFKDDNGNN